MSLKPLNNPVGHYNDLLKKYPLLTKSVTGALLAALGELISQVITSRDGDPVSAKRSLGQRLKELVLKPQYRKILLMFLYGGLVNAPINHFCYQWITKVTTKHVTTVRWRRLSQLCGSWFIVSPIQVLFLITALTVSNLQNSAADFKELRAKILQNIKHRYLPMLSSGIISSSVFVSIAQQCISPEKWSLFLSFAYAFLNTGQNVYMKMKSSKGKT
ncbi:LAMI_0H08152g1_1 [Lachancea mirantina]|uniref:LAMI_0H08152g1_1 n=1 Tax=Lachancea mirantina TaxID=1230905 RepID=A0A1G4KFT3_9SACH|nr:LAMI_0H08152g1_1 [Lachancea mirantina]